MNEHTKIKEGRAWTVWSEGENLAGLYWQALNPATGKGWQRQRDNRIWRGSGAKRKALFAWLYAK